MGGFVVEPVGDHQLDACGAAGVDHLHAPRRTDLHGLFAEHMLAGLRSTDGVLRVHAVGQRNVDGLDSAIGSDAAKVLVAVDGAGRHAILRGDALRLVAMSADQRGDLRLRGVVRALKKVSGDAAEPDDRVADTPCAGDSLRQRLGSPLRGKPHRTDSCKVTS